MPTKTEKGWHVDIRPEGRNGKRVRKTFDTKAEAIRFEAHTKAQAIQGDWNPTKDSRHLTELCDIWANQHGKNLKDGERRHRKLLATAETLGNPIANQLTAKKYLDYRSKQTTSAKTLNNELGYLNAVYNELERTEQISYNNPLSKIRMIKIPERELTYLETDQIQELLDSVDSGSENPHVAIITRICLATGARWGEAESLTINQVKNGQVTFSDTKSGKNRTIPITDPELYDSISKHLNKYEVMSSSLTAFRRALARCSFTLPQGQASHVLRHTFASHVIMDTGDLLTLKKILGHSSITMTERYAHLAPNHLANAVSSNPLMKLK